MTASSQHWAGRGTLGAHLSRNGPIWWGKVASSEMTKPRRTARKPGGGGAHGTRADQAPKGHETQAAGTAGGGAGTGPLETHKLETALEEEKAPASQPKVRGEAGVGGKMAGDTDACLGRLLRLP